MSCSCFPILSIPGVDMEGTSSEPPKLWLCSGPVRPALNTCIFVGPNSHELSVSPSSTSVVLGKRPPGAAQVSAQCRPGATWALAQRPTSGHQPTDPSMYVQLCAC